MTLPAVAENVKRHKKYAHRNACCKMLRNGGKKIRDAVVFFLAESFEVSLQLFIYQGSYLSFWLWLPPILVACLGMCFSGRGWGFIWLGTWGLFAKSLEAAVGVPLTMARGAPPALRLTRTRGGEHRNVDVAVWLFHAHLVWVRCNELVCCEWNSTCGRRAVPKQGVLRADGLPVLLRLFCRA